MSSEAQLVKAVSSCWRVGLPPTAGLHNCLSRRPGSTWVGLQADPNVVVILDVSQGNETHVEVGAQLRACVGLSDPLCSERACIVLLCRICQYVAVDTSSTGTSLRSTSSTTLVAHVHLQVQRLRCGTGGSEVAACAWTQEGQYLLVACSSGMGSLHLYKV